MIPNHRSESTVGIYAVVDKTAMKYLGVMVYAKYKRAHRLYVTEAQQTDKDESM